MFQTKITEMLGIRYPIVGGTMMHITTADFVAAIANAGGLGILASAAYPTRESLAGAVDRIRDLTDQPFAVNINLFPSVSPIDNRQVLDVIREKGVKIVETSGHALPDDLNKSFRDLGLIWIHKCVGVRYALKAQGMGADIVTVVGYENGGAIGKLDIATLVLVPSAVDALNVPVIGGGGVSDGRGLAALLALGASAVILGTRLLATRECPIHDNLKQALVAASETDTMIVMRSLGASHRAWANAAARKCLDLEEKKTDFDQIINIVKGENAKRMYAEGDCGAGMMSCGQGVGLIHDIPTVAALFDKMMAEAGKAVRGLCGC